MEGAGALFLLMICAPNIDGRLYLLGLGTLSLLTYFVRYPKENDGSCIVLIFSTWYASYSVEEDQEESDRT